MKGILTIAVATLIVLVLGSAFLPATANASEDGHHPATTPSHTTGTVQTECPVMPGQEISREFYMDYKGKRVYFCCKFCAATFRKEPEKYLANLPQFQATTRGVASAGHDEQAAGHDHVNDHDEPEGLARLVRFLGKFHSMAVHFPVALIITAALAEILALVFRSPFFRDAARYVIIVAALGAGVAAALGWATGAFARYPEEFSQAMTLHR